MLKLDHILFMLRLQVIMNVKFAQTDDYCAHKKPFSGNFILANIMFKTFVGITAVSTVKVWLDFHDIFH